MLGVKHSKVGVPSEGQYILTSKSPAMVEERAM